jgi:hypothetical protein
MSFPPESGDRMFITTGRHHGILTVGALRQALQGVDDDIQVVVDDGADWFNNVGTVIVPGIEYEGAQWSAVTLIPGTEMDTRQF